MAGRNEDTDRGITRRDALKLMGTAGMAGVLYSCTGTTTTTLLANGSSSTTAAAPATTTTTTQSVVGGSVTVGRTSAIEVLDPHAQPLRGFPGGAYTRSVFERLLALPGTDGSDALADVTAEGNLVTVQVREGITWHSGREFTADDVVWNIERVLSDDYPGVGFLKGLAAPIAAVRADSPSSATIELSAPDIRAFVFLMLTEMVDPDAAAAMAAGETASGTGPFRLEEFVPGRSMRLVPHDGYRNSDLPLLDSIDLVTVADEQTLGVQLESGDVHIAEPLEPFIVSTLVDQGDFQPLIQEPGNAFSCFVANLNAAPLDDKRVRQALMYAINRDRVNDESQAGFGTPNAVIWPPGSSTYQTDQGSSYPFDLDQARALLDEAGISDLELTVNVRNDLPIYAQQAEILRSDLSQIGVTLNTEIVEPAVHEEAINSGNYQLLSRAIGTLPEDAATLHAPTFFRPDPAANPTGFANERYTELANEVLDLNLSDDERQEKMSEITEIMLDEAWVLPVVVRPFTAAASSEVQGASYTNDAPLLDLRAATISA